MNFNELSQRPLKLKRNRVGRPFKGGLLLDKWQGINNPEDGYIPEEWVASAVNAVNQDPIENEGLSKVDLADGSELLLKDLIAYDPQSFLGSAHAGKYGDNMGVLVKVLDSYSRLLIQVHPDKNFAREAFNSEFGKTEAWYIIGGRSVNGEEPHVLFGFKPGITKEKWIELFEKQDKKGMEEALHKISVKPGDVFFVEGGIPHAAGAGVFFMEVQEPTDITIRTEKKNLAGQVLADSQLHQGIGFKKMFDCYHYKGYTKDELLDKWRLKPVVHREDAGGRVLDIIPGGYTPYFSMRKLEVERKIDFSAEGGFAIAVVLSGSGKVEWNGGELQLEQSDELFIPANVGRITWVNTGDKLDIVICYPPQ